MAHNQQPDELTVLRNNDARCIRILAACRRFAINLGGAAGNYATFAQNAEVLLEAFDQVEQAHYSPDGIYDELFTRRCKQAGLTPPDVHNLHDHWHKLQQAMEDSSSENE